MHKPPPLKTRLNQVYYPSVTLARYSERELYW